MTDAEVRKFEVMVNLLDFKLDSMPKYLLNQIHFCLMFIKTFIFFSDNATNTGPNKICLNFLVNATTSYETALYVVVFLTYTRQCYVESQTEFAQHVNLRGLFSNAL